MIRPRFGSEEMFHYHIETDSEEDIYIEADLEEMLQHDIGTDREEMLQHDIETDREEILQHDIYIEPDLEEMLQHDIETDREEMLQHDIETDREEMFHYDIETDREEMLQHDIETDREEILQHDIETDREEMLQQYTYMDSVSDDYKNCLILAVPFGDLDAGFPRDQNDEFIALAKRFGIRIDILSSSDQIQNKDDLVLLSGTKKVRVYINLKLLEGMRTFGKSKLSIRSKGWNLKPEIIASDGSTIQVNGLGKILAALYLSRPRFQSDPREIIVDFTTNGTCAEVFVSITERTLLNDEFSSIEEPFTEFHKEKSLSFNRFPPVMKREFSETFFKIIDSSQRELSRQFIDTDDDILPFFRDEMISDYKEYLELFSSVSELLHRDKSSPHKFNEEIKRNEALAFKDDLYFYIDPNVIFKGQPSQPISLTKAVNSFLDFSSTRARQQKVLLLNGQSGSGKTMALRWIEQQLLENRKIDEDVPVPIYINLKYCRKQNICETIKKILQGSCHDETGLKHLQYVLLLDWHDELQEENLDHLLHLDICEDNIKIIIAHGTQFLSSGSPDELASTERSLLQ